MEELINTTGGIWQWLNSVAHHAEEFMHERMIEGVSTSRFKKCRIISPRTAAVLLPTWKKYILQIRRDMWGVVGTDLWGIILDHYWFRGPDPRGGEWLQRIEWNNRSTYCWEHTIFDKLGRLVIRTRQVCYIETNLHRIVPS